MLKLGNIDVRVRDMHDSAQVTGSGLAGNRYHCWRRLLGRGVVSQATNLTRDARTLAISITSKMSGTASVTNPLRLGRYSVGLNMMQLKMFSNEH